MTEHLGRNKVVQNREKLCRDRGLLGRDRAGHDGGARDWDARKTELHARQGNYVMIENSLSRQTWTGLEVPMSRPDILGLD